MHAPERPLQRRPDPVSTTRSTTRRAGPQSGGWTAPLGPNAARRERDRSRPGNRHDRRSPRRHRVPALEAARWRQTPLARARAGTVARWVRCRAHRGSPSRLRASSSDSPRATCRVGLRVQTRRPSPRPPPATQVDVRLALIRHENPGRGVGVIVWVWLVGLWLRAAWCPSVRGLRQRRRGWCCRCRGAGGEGGVGLNGGVLVVSRSR